MMREEFPAIHYIRRVPMLAPLVHFNYCIEEARSDFFCLFHDDDLLSPDFVATMNACLHAYPMAIAYACNAVIENRGKQESRTSFRSFRELELITSARDLAARYFSRSQSGIAPFPSYVYNRRMVANQRLPVNSGKYADVAWLLNLAQAGLIVWLNKPLMTYRIHGGNDSNIESMRDRLRFLAYLKENRVILGPKILKDYRCSFIYKRIERTRAAPSSRRLRIALSFIKRYRWSRWIRLDCYTALAVRALIKCVAE